MEKFCKSCFEYWMFIFARLHLKFSLCLMRRIWPEELRAGEFLQRNSVRHTDEVYGLYLSSWQIVEGWREARPLQQTGLSIKASTVQLSQHYHPGEKNIPSPSVTSKLFPPSITFTRAPTAQFMLGTSLDTLSLQLTTQQSNQQKPEEAARRQRCDRSSEIQGETKSGKL